MGSILSGLIGWLEEPSVKDMNVDDGQRISVHAQILKQKPLLRRVFSDMQQMLGKLDRSYLSGDGIKVEIGAGVAPMKTLYPDVIATDLLPSPELDRTLDAEDMDLEEATVRVIYGQNCFHHLPHPERFFHELERVLCSGGGAILLEPYHGPVATFLFKRLFKTEGFDKEYPSWETPILGPMNGANQALSYIIFTRDKAEFEEKFPNLKIVHQEPCSNYLMYLLSGGLNFRQLCPNWTTPVIKFIQLVLSPLNRWLALHHVVVIRKEKS